MKVGSGLAPFSPARALRMEARASPVESISLLYHSTSLPEHTDKMQLPFTLDPMTSANLSYSSLDLGLFTVQFAC